MDLECQFVNLYFQGTECDISWMVRAEKAKVGSADECLFTVLILNLKCVYSYFHPVWIQMNVAL